MTELVKLVIPNVLDKTDELLSSIFETFYMMLVSGFFIFIFGMVLGIILVVSAKGGILENHTGFTVIDRTINIFRSIPFVILLAALIPLSRLIAGTAIGTAGAMVPLVVGTVPFFSRQVESALSSVDKGLIEAALSMGLSPFEIIIRVYLKESIPQLIRVSQITAISLIGLTAMAGAIGGGGLGDFAIRYGHQRGQTDVTYVTVVIILMIVSVIQSVGNYFIRRTSHVR